jgi:hypothetical protein
MILIAARSPHRIDNVPARAWAETLDLNDPAGLGARRFSDALQWLGSNQFIRLESRRGSPPAVRLLSALGDGQPFDRDRGIYLSVPMGLWEHHWITRLSGTGLALLLVLLDLQGGRAASNPPSLPGPLRQRYGLSDDTWTRAGSELQDLGLLHITTPWARLRLPPHAQHLLDRQGGAQQPHALIQPAPPYSFRLLMITRTYRQHCTAH